MILDHRQLRHAHLGHLGKGIAQQVVGRNADKLFGRIAVLCLCDQCSGDTLRFEQKFFLHPFVRVKLAQIMLSGVANDEYDEAVLVEVCRYLESGGKDSAGRTATKDTFSTAKLSRQIERIAISNIDDLVDDMQIGIADRQILADAFDQIRCRLGNKTRFLVGLKDRSVRVGSDYLDIGVHLL